MDSLSNRRRFLSLAGVGTATSIAGCSQFDLSTDGPQNDSGDQSDDADDGRGSATITAYVQPDEEDVAELQQRQTQLQQRAQAGDINESEYRDEMEALQADQTELLEEASAEFEAYADDADGLEVANSSTDIGLFLLEGASEAIVETLTDEAASGLLPEAAFEEAQQEQSPES